MKTRSIVESNVGNLVFGYYDEADTFVELDSNKARAKLAKDKAFNTRFIDAIVYYTEALNEALVADLADIWKRMDTIENNLKENGLFD